MLWAPGYQYQPIHLTLNHCFPYDWYASERDGNRMGMKKKKKRKPLWKIVGNY